MIDLRKGKGLVAREFSRRGMEICGLEANFEMLTASRNYVHQGKFNQAVVEHAPLKTGSPDLKICGWVLHKAYEPQSVLQTGRRVSRERVSILERPYRELSFGPPFADRSSSTSLGSLYTQTGFNRLECKDLKNVDLFRLSIRQLFRSLCSQIDS